MADEVITIEGRGCSNCRYSIEVAPYKVLLGCKLTEQVEIQPYTCSRWGSLLEKVITDTYAEVLAEDYGSGGDEQ